MCDDYMSDEILKLATEVDQKNNARKKIMKRRGEAGEIDKTQPLSKKRIQEMMEEKTEEGMEKAIDSTNKGYQLLQRFGYTEGAGLGKNNSGIENPLKITKREKSDRYLLINFISTLLISCTLDLGWVLKEIRCD
jgi:hypothetical protein